MMYWDGNMDLRGYILMGAGFVLFWAAVITAIIFFARSMGAGNPQVRGRRTGSGSCGKPARGTVFHAVKSTRANTPPGSPCSARAAGRNPPPSPGVHLDGYPIGVYVRL